MKSMTLKKGALIAALLSVPAFAMAQSSYDLPRTMPDTTTMPSTTAAPPPTPSTIGTRADTPLQRALADCDKKAVADRQVCRDQVIAQFNAGSSSTAVKPANDCAGLTGAAAADCLKGGNPGK